MRREALLFNFFAENMDRRAAVKQLVRLGCTAPAAYAALGFSPEAAAQTAADELFDFTKEPVETGGGKVVRCPDGYYISALQMMRDPGGEAEGGGQRWIKVWMKPFKVEKNPEPEKTEDVKEPADNGGSIRGTCPRGCYLSEIYFWRDPDSHAQGTIRTVWRQASGTPTIEGPEEGPFKITGRIELKDNFRAKPGQHICAIQIIKSSQDRNPKYFRELNLWTRPLPPH